MPMQEGNIVQEFATRRRRQAVATFVMLPAWFLALLWTTGAVSGGPGVVVSFVIVTLGALFSLFNWVCPACRRQLGKKAGLSPESCPGCGVRLVK